MAQIDTISLVCQSCGSAIGTVLRRKHAPHKLLIFAPASTVVMAEITGDAAVHCQKCGAVRQWFEDRAPAIKERLYMEDEEQFGI